MNLTEELIVQGTLVEKQGLFWYTEAQSNLRGQ